MPHDELLEALDRLRDAVVGKAEGLTEAQVRAAGVPSGTSLLGLVKHLAAVERFYVLGVDAADWPGTMRPGPDETLEALVADYRETSRQADAVIATWDDLDADGPRPPRRGPTPSRRWTLVHLLEETGRHAGHADVLREQLDGSTG